MRARATLLPDNNGPDDIDAGASLAVSGQAAGDCDISPPVLIDSITIPAGGSAEVPASFTAHCRKPSFHTFELSAEANAPLAEDPNPNNNSASASLTLAATANADLKITGWDVPLALGLPLSKQVLLPTVKTLHNNGPFGLVDVDVWKTMDVPPGLQGSVHATQPEGELVTVSDGVPFSVSCPGKGYVGVGPQTFPNPASCVVKVEGIPGGPELEVHFKVPGLPISVPVDVREEFDIDCFRPGIYRFILSNEIRPQDPHTRDPEPDNNFVKREVAATCVEIDTKPGSFPNSIDLKSTGVIPVAILTSGDFDATTVDPSTLVFAGASRRHCSIEDVDGDGDLDLICHFGTQETGIKPDDTEACVDGFTFDGLPIRGCDSVRIVPPRRGDQHPGHR